MKNKKAVMGEVISIFILVLIISILAGLTFLFTTEIKDQVEDQIDWTSISRTKENGTVNSTGYTVTNASNTEYKLFTLTSVVIYNATKTLEAANYTFTPAGVITNLTACSAGDNGWECDYWGWWINYTFSYTIDDTAYTSVNDTEAAGTTLVDYLPLVFLALIFGVILAIVLRIILPYIKLGERMGGGF